jgi:hypothetical protein
VKGGKGTPIKTERVNVISEVKIEMAKELKKKGRKTIVVETDPKPTSEKAAEPEKEKLLDQRVYAQMKLLAANGVKEFTSTLLRDKLSLDSESGRDQVRRAMKRLEKDGKITISEKANGKRKQYVYALK